MRKLSLLANMFFSLVGAAIAGETPIGPRLLFQSGFESSTELSNQSSDWVDLRGVDQTRTVANDWDGPFGGKLGSIRIQYGGGEPRYRLASIASDPEEIGNHFLRFWMREVNQGRAASYGGKGRIQMTVAGNDLLDNLSYKVRMRFSSDWRHLRDWEEPMGWLIFAEFWNNANWTDEGHPFRIHLTLDNNGESSGAMHFAVGAQRKDGRAWKTLWHESANSFDIPIRKWLTLECGLFEGDAQDGRFFFAVTPDGGERQVLFDVKNWTHHPDDNEPDGYSQFQPLKLYTHRRNVERVREQDGALQIDWDDLEIWTDRNPVVFEASAD